MNNKLNFAIIGVGGYVAVRHLKAIKNLGHKVVACVDKNDSVGIIDSYFPEAAFFTEFERFERHCEKLFFEKSPNKIDVVVVCSPNYLHDAHIRFGLRIDADVICEKPIVLNPWNVDLLKDLENKTHKKVYTILQLRYHKTIVDLKKDVDKKSKEHIYDIDLTYVAPRGKWYFYSWKSNIEKSGGVATNIGIHFFDMLTWIFGAVKNSEVYYRDSKKIIGYLEFERAKVKWFLSLDRNDLPEGNLKNNKPFRLIVIDGKELEFSTGFADLHTEVYKKTLNEGNGFRIYDALPSIKLVSDIRYKEVVKPTRNNVHPLLNKYL